VLPVPELLMCKAAALTRQIRFGASVKVLHLASPFDVAEQSAVTDHLLGGRFVFGFGSGFPSPWFARSRGLDYDERYERTAEALELILACWTRSEPFDWDGRFYRGKDVVVLPKPLQQPHPPLATATFTPETLRLAGERGYTLLTAGFPATIRAAADAYAAAALAAGRERPLEQVTASAFVYVADSVAQAIADMREAVEYELGFQRARGLLRLLAQALGDDVDPDSLRFEDLVDAGWYVVGDPDTVHARLERLYEESGGFGTLLLGVGKSWATRAKREESLRRFVAEVAPRLAPLVPDRAVDEAAASIPG